MIENEEQGVLNLANAIEDTLTNPEKTAKRFDKKTGAKGVLETIFDFIKSYKTKGDLSDEEWLKQQFAKPEYAKAWKSGEKEQQEAAQGIVQGVEDYENAKKSLRFHLENGGTKESWLSQQIEIGAEINGKDPDEYAQEILQGLREATEENKQFLIDDENLAKETE